MDTLLFLKASKKVKDLRIKLTQEVKELYNECLKALKRLTEGDIRKMERLTTLGVGRTNTVKMTILPKAVY